MLDIFKLLEQQLSDNDKRLDEVKTMIQDQEKNLIAVMKQHHEEAKNWSNGLSNQLNGIKSDPSKPD